MKHLLPSEELFIARIIYFPDETIPRDVAIARIIYSHSVIHDEEDPC